MKQLDRLGDLNKQIKVKFSQFISWHLPVLQIPDGTSVLQVFFQAPCGLQYLFWITLGCHLFHDILGNNSVLSLGFYFFERKNCISRFATYVIWYQVEKIVDHVPIILCALEDVVLLSSCVIVCTCKCSYAHEVSIDDFLAAIPHL